MYQSLIKCCLSNEFYSDNQARLRASLFDDTAREVYKAIAASHSKFAKDISPADLMAQWRAANPSSTAAWTAEIDDTINHIAAAPDIDQEIAADVIANLWRQSVGLDIANLGILMSEGQTNAMDDLKALLDKVSNGYMPDDFPEPNAQDIYEMLAVVSNDNRFKFNIQSVSNRVYGIGRGEFMIAAAYTNVGKTAFGASLSAAPAGFCEQGARVLYVCTEELASRARLRAIQAYTNLTQDEVALDIKSAMIRYAGINDRLLYIDAQGWDVSYLSAYINHISPDIVIIDIADKIEVSGKFNAGHERLRELYYRLRELAKTHNCAVIATSQASADAEGRSRLTMSMLEGSKVGKQSEADLLIGIGKTINDQDDDTTRYINIMKNKISGWHGLIPVILEDKVNRYVV